MRLSRIVALVAAAGLMLALAGTLWLTVLRPSAQQGRTAAAVDLGGAFALTDHRGRAVTDADFRGRAMLIYFGYTYCPDACPTGLTVVSQALDELGPAAAQVVPLFITVDPDRDSVAVMAEYVANFHPQLVGLTGTPDEIAAVAKAYRIYYAKAPPEEGAADEDYLVDHAAYTYLMDRDGGFVTVFSHGTGPEEIAAAAQKLLED